MSTKYLTKSKFKTAYNCARKLYYLENKNDYTNKNEMNEFLQALAEGGFQVGALAKCDYPQGIDLEGLSTVEAIVRTKELVQQQDVTIFEAALNVGPYLVLVDVLEKRGDIINLFEVKSKSIKSGEEMMKQKDGVLQKWMPYLIDIAFQTWVAKSYFGHDKVFPHLTLINSESESPVDGIHQNFLLTQENGRKKVRINPNFLENPVQHKFFTKRAVTDEVQYLLTCRDFPEKKTLEEYAHQLAQLQKALQAGQPNPIDCKKCEFRLSGSTSDSKKNGFVDCFISLGKMKDSDTQRPTVFEVWQKNDLFTKKEKFFMDEVNKEDLFTKKGEFTSYGHRQWLQIDLVKHKDPAPRIDRGALESWLKKVKAPPYHFIDFETTTLAIPMHRGRRPYEITAFQFSHHIMDKDGKITHQMDYLHDDPGEFPNFHFIRKLRDSLSDTTGTIFRYSNHENTVLRQIRRQLLQTQPSDFAEFCRFIEDITHPTESEESSGEQNTSTRDMVDLLEIIKDVYIHPLMGGSNSIKKVMPAILQDSVLLREKYSQPTYGKNLQIHSRNFEKKTWVNMSDDGTVEDPYYSLDPLHSDMPNAFDAQAAEDDGGMSLFNGSMIKDGGAAMTAWARMQFTEMSGQERQRIRNALLQYCELDTLSMVWIMEYMAELSKQK